MLDGHRFRIGDTSGFAPFQPGNGHVKQVVQPLTVSFEPLDVSLERPTFVATDFAKTSRLAGTHALWRGLHAFRGRDGGAGRLPAAWDIGEAEEVLALAEGEGCGGSGASTFQASAPEGCAPPPPDAALSREAAMQVHRESRQLHAIHVKMKSKRRTRILHATEIVDRLDGLVHFARISR